MTDATGLASVVITAAVVGAKYGSNGGEFTYAVNHVGDGIYESSSATGTVTIVAPDRTPPVLPFLQNLVVEATGPAGAVAEWGSLTAIDDLDGTVAVACTPASGSVFPIGATPVRCYADDAAGNRGENDFTVVVVDTTAPAVRISQPNADVLIDSGSAKLYVDVSDAVGATTVSVNSLAARLVIGTPQSGRWIVDVPVALSVPSGGALRFTAQASDAAGNAAATPTLVVDNDGIAGEMDQRLSDGADESQLFSSEFFYRMTPGTIERNGWAVLATPVFDNVDISAKRAGPAGSFARVWICGGSLKELRLDRVGENAQVTCNTLQGPGSVRVKAVTALPTIELSKLVTATSGWFRPRTYTYWTSTALTTRQTITTGSPLVADPENTEPITVTLVQVHDDGTELAVGTLVLDPGESADARFVEGAEGEDDRAEIVGLAGDVEVVIGGQTFHVTAGQTHVAVVDRTAPSIGESETIVVEASSAQGAVVTFALPSVVDAGDPAPHVSASPASGSTFAIGETTVMVTARDAAGNVSTATFTVTVRKATPVISWPPPAAITFGTALSATQLNATASVAGSFVYTPGMATVLPAGPAQPLSVTFTPTDTVTYTEATASVPITVTVPAILSVADVSLTEGNLAGAIKQAWLTVKLTQKSSEWVSVSYTTSDGSATKHVDYFTESSTILFAPGVVTQSVAIPIVQDTVGESTESFFVDFSGVVDGRLGQARSTITIVNDDTSSQVFTSTANFSAGILGGGAYLSETGDGELMLAPQGSEFSGTSLPEGWMSTPLVADASATVANGTLTIDGAALAGPSETGFGPTLEFAATFTASPDQSVGFGGSTALASPMAMFTVRSSDRQLYVRTINGTRTMETPIAGIDWLGKPHRYQIVWTAGTVKYYVDGTLMSSHTGMAWGAVTMRPVMIDSTAGDGALAVDWIRMTPYPGSGSYTSAVFDATDTVLWQKLRTTSTIPSGTTATITYRTGNTPSPDGSWTSPSPLGAGGVLTGSSRYVQFAIEMTTSSGAKTPVIQDVTVQFKR